MNWIFEDSESIPANKDSKITFDPLLVKRAINKVQADLKSGKHDLKKQLMKSTRKTPYRIVEYGENEALDMDYATIILVHRKHPLDVTTGTIFFDDTPQTDKEGNPVINPGIIFKSKGGGINLRENDIIMYISGHAVDRYCERMLKTPGHEMTDDELIDLYIEFNRMVV